MKLYNLKNIFLSLAFVTAFAACDKDDDDDDKTVDVSGTYVQEDQMGRPGITTVFITGADKDVFNTTVPSQMNAAFQSKIETRLAALSPAYATEEDTNALGQNRNAFTGLLATDVLNVSLDGKTTFFDGTNVLTGRALADDVIDVELLLIFGGSDGSENPGLTSDNVAANDKSFSASFPYLASPW